jgi:hypothetical protein
MFDSLDADTLAQAAISAGFPLDLLALGLSLHRAPRRLRVEGCYGQQVDRTGRSILAGCTLSTSLARAYLHPLRRHCGSDAGCRLSQHVDDLTQCVIAPNEAAAITRATMAARRLADKANELNLKVADKSRVVATTAAVAKAVEAGLRRRDVPIRSATAAEDLGVTTAGGRKRAIGSFLKRVRKGRKRAQRIRAMAQANGGAARLFNAGVSPQQSYDASVQGVSPQHMLRMRRNAAACVAPAGLQPCVAPRLAYR